CPLTAAARDIRSRFRRGLPIAGALVAVAILLFAVLTRIELRTDMTDLLPQGRTEAERFLMNELRAGPATSLILLGIEGAPPTELARISRSMAAALGHSGLFDLVNNGENTGFGSADQEFLFRHRYLLSASTTAEAFTVPALHADMQRLLRLLQSSASPLVTQFGLADPTGAFLALVQNWAGSAKIRLVDGVWFSSGGDRALILAKTRASGMDLTAEEQASQAIDRAFAAAKPGEARLLTSGPAIFSRDAARTIHHDVALISIASTILVAGLLLWRFRSGWVIAAIAIPTLLGLAAAALVVQLVFGFVHGVALGFGITMLGITVDYPVLLIGHRKKLEAAPATLRRIGQAFTLAVLTAAIGLTGMLFSGFPGLSQLGLFSVTGILVAAGTTRWLLPRLIVAADLAPVLTGDPARLLRVERLRALRGLGVVACIVAAGYLLLLGGPDWERDVAALSPVPAPQLALDAELRAELGAPDPGTVGMLRGDSAEAVLRKEEALLPVLDELQASSAISGAEIAARFLPSVATQLARRAALPDAGTLAASVAAARAGLPSRRRFGQARQDAARRAAVPSGGWLVRADRADWRARSGSPVQRLALSGCRHDGHGRHCERHRRDLHRLRLALAWAWRPDRARGAAVRPARSPTGAARFGSDHGRRAGDGRPVDRLGSAHVARHHCRATIRLRHWARLRAVLRAATARRGGTCTYLAHAGDLQRDGGDDLRPAGTVPDPLAA
ncbi:MAG: MMPL family transporter, partial [Alphaproteobacteria bacterium]|nr:MMPL family transporter [Alphaproteobacteria bacterium]